MHNGTLDQHIGTVSMNSRSSLISFYSIILSIFLTTFRSIAAPSDFSIGEICNDSTNLHFELMQRVDNFNPWKTFFPTKSKAMVRILGLENKFLAFNLSSASLTAADVKYKKCASSPLSLMEIQDNSLKFPDENLLGIQFFTLCGSNRFQCRGHEKLNQISSGETIGVFKIPIQIWPLPKDYEGFYQNSEETFARIKIHEMFHDFQFDKWSNMNSLPLREELSTCANNTVWKVAAQKEMKYWSDLIDADHPFDVPISQIIELLKTRKSFNDPETLKCWNKWEAWERIEGTAFFVEQAARLNSKVNELSQINLELKIMLNQFDGFSSGTPGREPYYSTGSILCHLLQKNIKDNTWQNKIEIGSTPAEIILAEFGR